MRKSIEKLWRRIRRPLVLVAAMALLGLLILIVYWAFRPYAAPDGAGFVTYDSGLRALRPRTLWDWLELLIVPLVLALAALWFNKTQKETELKIAERAREEEWARAEQARATDREIAEKARAADREIAENRQRQATLEAYYDRMTDLLLAHDLRQAAPNPEMRSIARARTIAVVRGLDGERKRQLLEFLQRSGLITRDAPAIDLHGADLSGADLSKADLSKADLSKADLSGAHLSGADLFGADLRGAGLRRADLSGADLSEADLRGADLSGANLNLAYLSGAYLSGAHLFGANLFGANLRGADLSVAKLREATLGGTDLSGTTMPDGVRLGSFAQPGPTFEEWLRAAPDNSEPETGP